MLPPDRTQADNLLAVLRLGQKVRALDRCRILAEAKAAYLLLHPETRRGGQRKKGRKVSGVPPFALYAAGLTGYSLRSILADIAIWNGLSAESRERLAASALSGNQRCLRAIAKLPHTQQAEAITRWQADPSALDPLPCAAPPDLSAIPTRDLLAELIRREDDRHGSL